MLNFFFILFLPLVSFAQSDRPDLFNLSEEELNPESEDVLIKKPEKYLRNESMLYDFNSNLGIKDQRHYTGADRNRLSLAGHVSGDYEHFSDILGVEVNMMRRSTRYNQVWWGGQFFRHNTYFDAITQNTTNGSANPASENAHRRPGNTRATVTAFGLGAGYRFKLLLDFWRTEDVFETIDVFANVLQMDDKWVGKSYKGYGLTTSYGLHKRTNTSYFYGGKFSYNIASVVRPPSSSERTPERSFALGWLTFAAELGFFF